MTFEEAQEKVNTLSTKPSNDILLELYGLFKQATVGDLNEPKPPGFDFKALAKYKAWDMQKGKSITKARAAYIELVTNLLEKDA